MDDQVREFLTTFRRVAELSTSAHASGSGQTVGDALTEHLDAPAREQAVVAEEVAPHRYADWDLALEMLAERDEHAREIGVGGGDMRYHQTLADIVADQYGAFNVGQVDYISIATGPDSHRRAVGFGLRLFTYRGTPVGVFQRRGNARMGQDQGTIEIIATDREAVVALLDEARELSVTHSVLRGQVIAFEASGFGMESAGITFLPRTQVQADEVVLPERALERIVAHVSGIAEHAETLRRHGQHLKRGLLLYGPPGTGKTHTVRHLISRCQDHTVVVMAGESLAFVSTAATVARALQPAIVVLEDCDLVAEDRGMSASGRPLLFEVLDAMDGLDADADVTFLLTTNRVESLEHALVQRPGRVDLAVEVPLPDLAGRRRLLDLYRGDVEYSAAALDDAAHRCAGLTASFTKELMRRAVLEAAIAGAEPDDTHLSAALDGLLAASEDLTRALLGTPRPSDPDIGHLDTWGGDDDEWGVPE
ncbi:MAG: ATP-binding protein [Mobilicoccus sp.]|nr:ATP-binding protein [Mobilicoccus sp.]